MEPQPEPGVALRRPMTAKRIVQYVAFALTVAAGLCVLFAPTYQVVATDSDGTTVPGTATVLDASGPWAIVMALAPVMIAATPLLVPRRAWQPVTIVATVMLVVWGALGAWTIGIFYAPAILFLIVSVFLPADRIRSGRRQ